MFSCISSNKIVFTVNGCSVEVVRSAAHLGHVISHEQYDYISDILRCRDQVTIGRLKAYCALLKRLTKCYCG